MKTLKFLTLFLLSFSFYSAIAQTITIADNNSYTYQCYSSDCPLTPPQTVNYNDFVANKKEGTVCNPSCVIKSPFDDTSVLWNSFYSNKSYKLVPSSVKGYYIATPIEDSVVKSNLIVDTPSPHDHNNYFAIPVPAIINNDHMVSDINYYDLMVSDINYCEFINRCIKAEDIPAINYNKGKKKNEK